MSSELRSIMKTIIIVLTTIISFAAMAYSDWERVSDRLQLIETLLRSREFPNWSPEKLDRRKISLQYLHDYWTAGKFPKNLTHLESRHPIFQDQDETLCAVGYLMHRWGYDEAIKRIRTKSNEAYIEEINDFEMAEFIEKSGLDVEELKLIQPAYAPPEPMLSSINQQDWPALEAYVKQGKSKKILFLAVYLEKTSVAKWILDSGIDPNFQERSVTLGGGSNMAGGWPLEMAAANENLELIRLLIQRGARGSNGNPMSALVSPMEVLGQGGSEGKESSQYYMEIVSELLKSGATLPKSLDILKLVGCTSLEHLKILEKNGFDAKSNFGRKSALGYCARNGSLEVVDYLLKKGIPPLLTEAQVSIEEIRYNSPIHIALDNGRTDLLPVFNKYAPLSKMKLAAFDRRYWYKGEATLAGYIAVVNKSEMFSKLKVYGIKPNDEDLVWASTIPEGIFEKFKSLNNQGFLKNRFRLIQIFTETCQLQRLKDTLKGLPISKQTEQETEFRVRDKTFRSKQKIFVLGKASCAEGIKLVIKKFPLIEVR